MAQIPPATASEQAETRAGHGFDVIHVNAGPRHRVTRLYVTWHETETDPETGDQVTVERVQRFPGAHTKKAAAFARAKRDEEGHAETRLQRKTTWEGGCIWLRRDEEGEWHRA